MTLSSQEQEPKWKAFERELAGLINKYSLENNSNTPDYILAHYLHQCLMAYESLKRANDEHHND